MDLELQLPGIPPVPAGLSLYHLAPALGTEVHGIDLREELSTDVVDFLKALLLQRKVIFFRDQEISVERQIEICRLWGELEIIDFLPQHSTHPEALHIKRGKDSKGYENIWHSDVTWRECPSKASMLRAVKVPEVGGDTMWACMETAYEVLPEPLKRFCEGLTAVHSVAQGLSYTQGFDKMAEQTRRFPPQAHPVIRTHPETGRKSIYVNRAHTSYLRGIDRHLGAELLNLLYRRADVPEVQCRFHWRANSIAFWDNRSTQHYAISDYFPAEREMYRVTVAGDKPF